MIPAIVQKKSRFKEHKREVVDEEGRVIRTIYATEMELFWEETYPDSWAAQRYEEREIAHRCRCGVMVFGRNKCCKCSVLPFIDYAYNERCYGTDRADMEAAEARFRIGILGVDWMIENYREPTVIVRDGRDQDHEDWWGG